MSAINSLGQPARSVATTPAKPLGQADFLKLMTTQLKAQDPFDPVDNQAMVAQMAQFSSVAGIGEINTTLKAISTQLATQTELLEALQPSSNL